MRGSLPSTRLRLLVAAALVTLATGGAVATGSPPAKAASAVTVSINVNQSLATVPSAGSGANTAVYDAHMNDSSIPGLLSGAGINALRYPGGSYADVYHWQTNTADGGTVAPNTDFDDFMATAKAAGAQPIITADYGSGSPQEAAAWVKYANITKGYGVKYWEIGNEIPGNGEYGAQWETDLHSSHSATTYANNLLQFASAMKAVDPTIKIGAVLCTPGSWPDGIVGPGDTMDWNDTVLSIAGPKIDFVIVHYYPASSSTSEATMLTYPQAQIPGIMSSVHSLLNKWAGSNAPNVGVAITETNGTIDPDTSPSALFAADDYLTFLENGVFNVDWWDMHNGTDCTKVTTVDGATDYNDGGFLSSGASCEPAANTPFAPYYGIGMVSKLGSPGDTLVHASSSNSLLIPHAVRRANGDVDVMLINEDPDNAATVSLSYNGFTPSSSTPTVYSYLKNATSITSSASGTSSTQTVPAYSIEVIQLHPSGSGGGTSSSGALHAVGSGKCLDVNGSSTTPGTQLQIWDCNGGANQTWTHTSSGRLTVYSGSSQMCLDDYGAGTANGTKADIWNCNGASNQQWNLNSDGTITSASSGLCLDVTGGGTADGTLVELWACNGGNNQQWSLG